MWQRDKKWIPLFVVAVLASLLLWNWHPIFWAFVIGTIGNVRDSRREKAAGSVPPA